MSETIGEVDEEGYYPLVTYQNEQSWDMEQMINVLRDPELESKVVEYDDKQVRVLIRHPYEGL
jgi:hypothetical protein